MEFETINAIAIIGKYLGGITSTGNDGKDIFWADHDFDYVCELKIDKNGLPNVAIYFERVIWQMIDNGNEKSGRKLMAKLYTLSGELLARNINIRGQ